MKSLFISFSAFDTLPSTNSGTIATQAASPINGPNLEPET